MPQTSPHPAWSRFCAAVSWPVSVWVLIAVWYLDPLSWPARTLLVSAWGAALFLAARHARRRALLPLAACAGALAILTAWGLRPARLAAAPSPDQARAPRVEISGPLVTVHDVRYARYRGASDYDVEWQTRRYDLRDLAGVDFIVEPFEALRALAHTFVSFGFKDGEHLALSFETEHTPGRPYGPLRGLFHQYVLRPVIGDERDLIGLRTDIRRDDVYVYPLRTDQTSGTRLFLLLMARVNQLGLTPEYYNTLTNNCTTQYRAVYETLTHRSLRFEPRVYLPGCSDGLALDLGLIEWSGDVAGARRRFRVNGRVPLDGRADRDGREWSRRLRSPTPEGSAGRLTRERGGATVAPDRNADTVFGSES